MKQRGAKRTLSENGLLTQDGACEFLGITRQTIRTLRKQEENPIPYLLVGRQYRYRKEDLLAWAERNAKRSGRKKGRRKKKFCRGRKTKC